MTDTAPTPVEPGEIVGNPYVRVRCPRGGRLAAEVSPGSTVRVKCGRCKTVFTRRPADTIRR